MQFKRNQSDTRYRQGRTSIKRIIKKNNFYLYKVQLQQTLSEDDYQARLTFCEWILNKITVEPSFSGCILFSDESTFHNNGHINRHNFHFYANENPHFTRSIDRQHRSSLNVRVGILGERVIDPYFFEGPLNGDAYLNFVKNILQNLLEDVPLDLRRSI